MHRGLREDESGGALDLDGVTRLAAGKMVATSGTSVVIAVALARSKMVHAGATPMVIGKIVACVKIDPDGG